jgi:hypothetical protein
MRRIALAGNFMKDIEEPAHHAFFLALVRHWVALVASGLLAVALIVLPAWNVAVPKPALQAAILFCVIVAAFGAWKDERRRAERLAAELAEAKGEIRRLTDEAEAEGLEVSDEEYWVLLAVAKCGLRRGTVNRDRFGATAGLLILGETAIDFRDCQWFYSTVAGLERRGAIRAEGGTIHRLTDEGKQAIQAGKKLQRRISQPDHLIDGRSGAVVTLPL